MPGCGPGGRGGGKGGGCRGQGREGGGFVSRGAGRSKEELRIGFGANGDREGGMVGEWLWGGERVPGAGVELGWATSELGLCWGTGWDVACVGGRRGRCGRLTL